MLPTSVFLPRECHGKTSLVGYSPWGRKESDLTEQLTLVLFIQSNTLNTCLSPLGNQRLICLEQDNKHCCPLGTGKTSASGEGAGL